MKKEDLKAGMQIETRMSDDWGIGTILFLGKTHALVSYNIKHEGEDDYYYENAETYDCILTIIKEEN